MSGGGYGMCVRVGQPTAGRISAYVRSNAGRGFFFGVRELLYGRFLAEFQVGPRKVRQSFAFGMSRALQSWKCPAIGVSPIVYERREQIGCPEFVREM